MESNEFGRWLQHQLDRRNWKQADLVQQGSFSRSAVSDWINGKRLPDPASADLIADALHIDVETVLRKAGHLPDPGTIDEFQAEIIALVRRIDWNQQRVDLARAVLEQFARNYTSEEE